MKLVFMQLDILPPTYITFTTLPYSCMFLALDCVGGKCRRPCAMGNRCSPNCKELAEEIEKMHDDSHYTPPGYRSHHCAFNIETMEEEMINP